MHSRSLLFAKVMRWLALCVLALGALGVHARAMANAPLEKIASSDVVCTPVRAAQVLDSTQENTPTYGGCTSWGIYMGVDPVDFKEDNIHSFNRYTYANNNPYRYIDPDGREAMSPTYNVWNRAFNTNQTGSPANGAPGFELAKQGMIQGAVEGAILSAQVGTMVSPLGLGVQAAKGVLPAAAAKIDPVTIREIEGIVRSGGSAFPLETGAQLRAVAESFASKVRSNLAEGLTTQAAHVRDVGLGAVDRLDRFKALTPEATQQLRGIISGAFKP